MGLGRILINRNGAYGDMIHMSHLPRLLKDQGWDFIGVSTGYKGVQILQNNPFINQIHYLEINRSQVSVNYYMMRVDIIAREYDRIIDLLHTLEIGALALEYQKEYYQHISMRRDMGRENYYDITTRRAGFPDLCGKYRGEMFFDKKEIEIVEHDLLRPGRYKDNFKVLINLAGTLPHKVFIQAEEVVDWIIKTYPEAIVFLSGDKHIKELDFSAKHERIKTLVGKKGFRQVALMTKYMDCFIGCESGLGCIASMWDIPTIQLMTCADIYNHCKYAENDYSLQSPAKCSPCYKGPYSYWGCPKKNRLPICVYFNVEQIKGRIKKIHDEYLLRRSS
jgi:ADP-heptose:LPS heptosyltransferase